MNRYEATLEEIGPRRGTDLAPISCSQPSERSFVGELEVKANPREIRTIHFFLYPEICLFHGLVSIWEGKVNYLYPGEEDLLYRFFFVGRVP